MQCRTLLCMYTRFGIYKSGFSAIHVLDGEITMLKSFLSPVAASAL